jgi:hypothetical protein
MPVRVARSDSFARSTSAGDGGSSPVPSAPAECDSSPDRGYVVTVGSIGATTARTPDVRSIA